MLQRPLCSSVVNSASEMFSNTEDKTEKWLKYLSTQPRNSRSVSWFIPNDLFIVVDAWRVNPNLKPNLTLTLTLLLSCDTVCQEQWLSLSSSGPWLGCSTRVYSHVGFTSIDRRRWCGTWWRLGWDDDLQPEGRGFDYRSSRHVGTLGKSFTRSCLCASAWNSDTVSVL